MSKIYIGIDPSFTNTGIVMIGSTEIRTEEYHIEKIGCDDSGESNRLYSGCRIGYKWAMEQVLSGQVPLTWGIEVPMGSHFGAAVKVDRLYGYWVGWLHCKQQRVMTFTPPQIKKFFTGSGRADKETMVWFANNVWDFPCTSHDIADAFAIAMLVKHIDEGKYDIADAFAIAMLVKHIDEGKYEL